MKKIDLVFRTVGERTSKIALELAIRHIQPQQVHIIENIKPFSLAVQQMLRINYECDLVVFMDADCLIMEDMTAFLQENDLPYIDCYVRDKFRGQVHCGVHIVKIDVVNAMQKIKPPQDDPKYLLRPESRIRDLAMSQLNVNKVFKSFKILHDFCQFHHDIFIKYALRELRSRTDYHQAKLKAYQENWLLQPHDQDFQVAQYAVEYARQQLALNSSVQELAKFIEKLPEISIHELTKLEIPEKEPLTLQEIENLSAQLNIQREFNQQPRKIFGIGLSCTGTNNLNLALNMLGFNVAHCPDDEVTLQELMIGKYDFSLLYEFDGITDITVAPFYAQLDNLFPGSKFILTICDKKSWLHSVANHFGISMFTGLPSNENIMFLRRMLRVAVYGSYTFNESRFSYVYDLHYNNVVNYFKKRPDSLLIININAGEGWEKLCPFLELPILEQPFPFVNG
ncbi:sulfotransferase family protein [Calothrix sp. PCC 7507]|uniref:sulfotransferase family protein n=1 Tax=Calothrix sp. PCC 7507 TaxID=99598 RepID=UPI00029F23D9|nr:sulfotransferase family protein [Calothrix sp. PCC 7507]AFY31843.1 hypothetical protein Cal7507_1376 [Calothrix sp. PCC 7507]